MKIDVKLFEKSIIAQDDDNDYEESGYAVCYFPNENKVALFSYSHCSCFGTWESISGSTESSYDEHTTDREVNPVWEGTPNEFIHLAEHKLDPAMPSRESSNEDYDHDHLMNVYTQGLEYFKKNPLVQQTKGTKMNEKQTWKLTNREVYYIYKSLKNLPTNHLAKDEIQIIENLTKRFGSASSNIIEDENQKE